jgi:hypothetical protein
VGSLFFVLSHVGHKRVGFIAVVERPIITRGISVKAMALSNYRPSHCFLLIPNALNSCARFSRFVRRTDLVISDGSILFLPLGKSSYVVSFQFGECLKAWALRNGYVISTLLLQRFPTKHLHSKR